nr:uncharacterized protein LOC100180673 isoform X3 [Ciona intestinalis]|eukprot:XP_026696575.1 uncharacterized protein LOC100180673 isoform X3 [Ciona intestinalis]
MDEEMSKITFTYYGTSIDQLYDVLKRESLCDVTVEEIRRQNVTKEEQDIARQLPTLQKLCKKSNIFSSSRKEQINDLRSNSRQRNWNIPEPQRYLNKRPCAVGRRPNHQLNQLMTQRKEAMTSLMNPLNRHLLMEKIQIKRSQIARRKTLHGMLNTAFHKSTDPYEKWWFHSNDLMSNVNVKQVDQTASNTSFFGNSWILDTVTSSNNDAGEGISFTSTKKRTSGDILVENLAAVDTWKCQCDICTGAFLQLNQDLLARSSPGDFVLSMRQSGNRSGKPAVNGKKGNRRNSKWAGKNKDQQDEGKHRPRSSIKPKSSSGSDGLSKSRTASAKSRIDSANSKPTSQIANSNSTKSKIDSNHSKSDSNKTSVSKKTVDETGDTHNRKSSAKKPKPGAKTKRGQQKRRNSKVPLNNDIWWESLSTYVTPHWKAKAGAKSRRSEEKSDDSSLNVANTDTNSINVNKLKISYSFDRLRSKKEKRSSITSQDDNATTEIKVVITRAVSMNSKALNAHGILYTYVPGASKDFRKLQLPADVRKSGIPGPEDHVGDTEQEILGTYHEKAPNTKKTLTDSEHALVFETTIVPPTLPDNKLENSDSKCFEFLTSQKSCAFMADQNASRQDEQPSLPYENEQFFETALPKEFAALCVASLRLFVVRTETVMTSNGFKRVDSLTINRTPLFTYGEDSKQQKK